jgi:hypothetical protein
MSSSSKLVDKFHSSSLDGVSSSLGGSRGIDEQTTKYSTNRRPSLFSMFVSFFFFVPSGFTSPPSGDGVTKTIIYLVV